MFRRTSLMGNCFRSLSRFRPRFLLLLTPPTFINWTLCYSIIIIDMCAIFARITYPSCIALYICLCLRAPPL